MHRYTDAELKALLKKATIVQSIWVSAAGRFVLFLLVLALCGAAAAFYQSWVARLQETDPRRTTYPNGANVAAVLVAGVAAIFAYYQWADTRRESSLEKFYERLKLTNDRYDGWPHARQLVGHFWPAGDSVAEFQRSMYTFLELDNLEYMIVRYQLGFVRKRLMYRAIRTFASRCERAEFRGLASQLARGSGYDEKTSLIVTELAALADLRAQRPA